jgi:hypothetical protein
LQLLTFSEKPWALYKTLPPSLGIPAEMNWNCKSGYRPDGSAYLELTNAFASPAVLANGPVKKDIEGSTCQISM